MAGCKVPQIVPLAQQLTHHLKHAYELNLKVLEETERARKTFLEIMTIYDEWKTKLELEG